MGSWGVRLTWLDCKLSFSATTNLLVPLFRLSHKACLTRDW